MNPFDHWIKMLLGEIKPVNVGTSRTYSFGVLSEAGAKEVVLRIVDDTGLICGQELIEITGYKKTTVYRVLDELVDEGVLIHTRALYKGRPVKHYCRKDEPSHQFDLGL